MQSVHGYGDGSKAPGIEGIGTSLYIAAHNQIRAHAKAYRLYQNEFAATQGGQCGITLNTEWGEPEDPNDPASVEAAENNMQFYLGWFMHPIYVNGDYPDVMREKVSNLSAGASKVYVKSIDNIVKYDLIFHSQIDTKSELQGFPESRLPTFTAEESAEILGSHDFLGINFYTSGLGFAQEGDITDISYWADKDAGAKPDPKWYPYVSTHKY